MQGYERFTNMHTFIREQSGAFINHAVLVCIKAAIIVDGANHSG
jgi:hypothetical protein